MSVVWYSILGFLNIPGNGLIKGRAAFLQMLGEFSVHCRKYIDKAVVVVVVVAMHSLW